MSCSVRPHPPVAASLLANAPLAPRTPGRNPTPIRVQGTLLHGHPGPWGRRALSPGWRRGKSLGELASGGRPGPWGGGLWPRWPGAFNPAPQRGWRPLPRSRLGPALPAIRRPGGSGRGNAEARGETAQRCPYCASGCSRAKPAPRSAPPHRCRGCRCNG